MNAKTMANIVLNTETFVLIMLMMGLLRNFVTDPTHIRGPILHLVITILIDLNISEVVVNYVALSDHCYVLFKTSTLSSRG